MRKFLGVYYEWGRDTKVTYAKMTTNKDVNKLVEGHDKYTRSGVKVHKTTGDSGKTLRKISLETPYNIEKHRSLFGQLMWYTTKVVTGVANEARELVVQMSHTGPEHWKELGILIDYIKGKQIKGIVNRKPKVMKSVVFCYSNYSTYKETRNNVSGLVVTLGGTLLTCSSNT